MAVTLAPQESRREHLEGSTGGAAIPVALDYTTAGDVTPIHHVTSGQVDSVWLQVWNTHTSAVTLNLVLNPSDDTNTTEIDAVTVTVSLRATSSVWLLQGDAFRLRGSNTTTITAYTATADINRVLISGYVVRTRGALLY